MLGYSKGGGGAASISSAGMPTLAMYLLSGSFRLFFPSIRVVSLVPGSGVVLYAFVVSHSLGTLICLLCGGSTWDIVSICGNVSAAFQYVRTGEGCEHACASEKDANC